MSKATNEVGNIYGQLTVIAETGANKFGEKLWKCRCSCGNEVIAKGKHLRSGHTRSCGCLQKEATTKRNKDKAKYGFIISVDGEEISLGHTRLYRSWYNMINRCANPKCKDYKDYGQRGISVCDPWLNDFLAFAHWAYANGYYEQPKNTLTKDVLSIDRIDSNGNYEPSNCRWITVSENSTKRNIEHAKKVKNE